MKAAKLASVLDEVLVDATAAARRHTAETEAVKTAAAEPRTELARGLRALAREVRASTETIVTYGDLS